MVESLFEEHSLKTPREHDLENSVNSYLSSVNSISPRDMSVETLTAFKTIRACDINRVEPRELNSRPVIGREFFV
jgi:hypothetical protein